GTLFLTLRGKGANVPPGETDCGLENTYEHFRVYRSTDGGLTWTSIIHQAEVRAPSPVTINSCANGDLYLAANPWRPMVMGSDGKPFMKTKARNDLSLWRLSDDRCAVGEEVPILDCKAVLGPPRQAGNKPADNCWYADHPIGYIFHLADG